MIRALPEEVWRMICDEVALQKDLQRLFSLVCTCKTLAPLACRHLYRLYNESSNSDEEADDPANVKTARWAVMWRSIILSAMDGTILPYYRYLRVLNLRDLQNFLQDDHFRRNIQNKFLSGPLDTFRKHFQTLVSKHGRSRIAIDDTSFANEVGSLIVPRTTFIEQLSGNLLPKYMMAWTPTLTHLQRLELWDGSLLADKEVQGAITKYCVKFKELSVKQWGTVPEPAEADAGFESFLNALPANTLTVFITISKCGVARRTCEALNRHSKSLQELELAVWDPRDIQGLGASGDFESLVKLDLEMAPHGDLKDGRMEVYNGVQAWLKGCKSLREIRFTEFYNGPELLRPLLEDDEVSLEEFHFTTKSINRTTFRNMLAGVNFYHKLALKKATLHTLFIHLQGETLDLVDSEVDSLVDALVQLTNLKHLELRGLSDCFEDDSMSRLFLGLRQLQDVYIGGILVTDLVLQSLSGLHDLKNITFIAFASFSAGALLGFVDKLQPTNEGLHLSVDNADPDPDRVISDLDQEKIRNALWQKVGGRFDYITQELDVSDFELESD